MTAHVDRVSGLKGKHVLAIFCGFFGTVFAVLGTFAYLAVHSFPGDEAGSYQRGLRYNGIIADAARQQELGWQLSARYDGGRLEVDLKDKAGKPLSGYQVDARIGRPATGQFDRGAVLQAAADGAYAAPVTLDPGTWVVSVRVNPEGTGIPFNEIVRIWIGDRR